MIDFFTGGVGVNIMTNWSDAFSNSLYIEGAAEYPVKWSEQAADFRQALKQSQRVVLNRRYANKPRNLYDLFLPKSTPKGLIFFVHGGFWHAFDKSSWSHLSKGCLEKGYAVAVISYTLCPDVSIEEITREVACALEVTANDVAGPIHLVGHSAGGHLISRMLCQNILLDVTVHPRIGKCLSISGVHDLRPLIHTEMNSALQIELPMAQKESPVLLTPRPKIDLCCWVGSNERPEFLRQSQLLADMWCAFDVRVDVFQEPLKHHFNVIEGLCDSQHPIINILLEKQMQNY